MTAATSTEPQFGNQQIDADALSRATTDGSLEMVYQPELDLDSGAIVAMEGLVRWRHAGLGQLKPRDFLHLANRTGVMAAIDDWVLRTGAAEVASWMTLPGPARHLWLNVSLAQLRRPAFVQELKSVIDRNGLPTGVLGLEISEKTVLDLGRSAQPLLVELRRTGVSLAVDDFTSYYATLGAISTLPIDCVKIGRRYIAGVGEVGADDTFVATVIEKAHSRGIYVVAEGVESWSESARLTELGCDRAHGFLYSSAQRPDRARWLLTQGVGWRGQAVTPEVHAIPFPSPPHASS
jgi:EAL domain-containing protein (putative c-di-GMP-specific phosphodiesterase class I)